ncbi:MAG: hypothetical protein M1830_001590 [Pleopsidium flavum]|nr:MAG: hypothetical protein M1830_001590 [Pleopsidium flavum]
MPFTVVPTPAIHEPLPLYSRDPETISIRSSAPSYTSEAPSYHSSRPPNLRSITFAADTTRPPSRFPANPGLPSSRYAPGFSRGRSTGSVSNVENHKFNISEWSSVTSGHQARHYQNVAHRRATIASAEDERNALAMAMQTPKSQADIIKEANVSENRRDSDSGEEKEEDDTSRIPLEDPHLVGHEAAAKAKAQRLYMRRCIDEEALRQEQKTWDFMLTQMADWKEREKSWEKFRKEVGRSRLLGRRTGLRGSVS